MALWGMSFRHVPIHGRVLPHSAAVPADVEGVSPSCRSRSNRPLKHAINGTANSEHKQRESDRRKFEIRVRIEHVFGPMSPSLRGFCLRYTGQQRNAAAIGLTNLVYSLARYEPIVRVTLRPGTAA